MILNVSIENFRSIKKANISLPKFSAVIGKNSSGKSNFISAISLLKDLSSGKNLEESLTKIAPLGPELFYFHNYNNTESKFKFSIQSNQGNKFRYEYFIVPKRIGLTVEHELLSQVIDNKEKIIYRREKENAFKGEPNEEKIPFKIDPDKLMLSSYSDEQVKEVVKTISGYTIIDTMPESNNLMVINAKSPDLNSIDGVVISLFNKNHGRFSSAINSIKKIIPYFEEPVLTPLPDLHKKNDSPEGEEEKLFVVMWKERNFPEQYSNLSLSHGDRKIIHLIFSLFNTPEKSFFIAEEIENGMHFERMSRLVDQIRTQASNRKIQVLFTTHSSEILKRLTVNEVIYCRKNKDKGTELDQMKDTEEYEAIKNELGSGNACEVIQTGLFD
jgi:predicted ATPase